jgi:hypothetical protein
MRHEILAIRLLVRDGISVSDTNSYSPLPEKETIEPLLREIEVQLSALERALNFTGTAAKEPESTTRFVLRIRLDMLTDEVPRNLSPENISRDYGAVPAEVAGTLNLARPKFEHLLSELTRMIKGKGVNP